MGKIGEGDGTGPNRKSLVNLRLPLKHPLLLVFLGVEIRGIMLRLVLLGPLLLVSFAIRWGI
jgi:hypothetical protein